MGGTRKLPGRGKKRCPVDLVEAVARGLLLGRAAPFAKKEALSVREGTRPPITPSGGQKQTSQPKEGREQGWPQSLEEKKGVLLAEREKERFKN